MTLRPTAALFTACAAAALFAGCGSDTSDTDTGTSASAGTGSSTVAAVAADSVGGEDRSDGPCGLTDRATVAAVFPGAGEGRPGQVRNCEFSFASGPVQTVNVYLYEEIDLAQFRKQAKDNGISYRPVTAVGDGAIRDQLHTLTVQQGSTLFSVQAIPRAGITEAKLAPFDPQTLALAKRIAAAL